MSPAIARAAVVAVSILMLGNTKGIDAIPRRDDAKPPPAFEVRAEAAYEDGRLIQEQAAALAAKAGAAGSDRQRRRLESKAARRYRESIGRLEASLTLLSEAVDRRPAYLHDLYLRLAEAFLATSDAAAARGAVEAALELRPDHLGSLYALARIELAQYDLDAVQRTYQRLLSEAEVYGAAWDYVDRLLALMQAAASPPEQMPGDRQRSLQFRAWLDEQATLAAETVRWSALPD